MKNIILTLALITATAVSLSAYAIVPEKLCISRNLTYDQGGPGTVKSPDTDVTLRIRARVHHYNPSTGKTKEKGDIYPDYQTKTIGLNKYACVNTKTLETEILKKFSSKAGYSLSNVRMDLKGMGDCQLGENQSVHAWMGAPRKGTVYFKFKSANYYFWDTVKCTKA